MCESGCRRAIGVVLCCVVLHSGERERGSEGENALPRFVPKLRAEESAWGEREEERKRKSVGRRLGVGMAWSAGCEWQRVCEKERQESRREGERKRRGCVRVSACKWHLMSRALTFRLQR